MNEEYDQKVVATLKKFGLRNQQVKADASHNNVRWWFLEHDDPENVIVLGQGDLDVDNIHEIYSNLEPGEEFYGLSIDNIGRSDCENPELVISTNVISSVGMKGNSLLKLNDSIHDMIKGGYKERYTQIALMFVSLAVVLMILGMIILD